MHRRSRIVSLLTCTLLGALACSDDEAAAPTGVDAGLGTDAGGSATGVDAGLDASIPPGFVAVTLRFKARVGSDDFACGRTYPSQGSTKVPARPGDFRFFVEKVRLVTRAGVEVPVQLGERAPHQTPEVGLIDFTGGDGTCSPGATPANTTLTGIVPDGDYTGVVFSNGVPESLNHGDPTAAPAPLKAPGVNWSWLRGYRFILASLQHVPSSDGGVAATPDLDADAGSASEEAPGTGLLHVGSLSCTGGVGVGFSCARPNRNEIRLSGFDPRVNTIVADLGAVFSEIDLVRGVACHLGGEDYCGRLFPAVGLDLASGAALSTQRVFHVE